MYVIEKWKIKIVNGMNVYQQKINNTLPYDIVKLNINIAIIKWFK